MSALSSRSWGYPDCPDCETDVFVGGTQSTQFDAPYECHFCGTRFGGETA
jgi:predicted RNA-binding Zn-ribbon protein involved in translation (DUF1610 family)